MSCLLYKVCHLPDAVRAGVGQVEVRSTATATGHEDERRETSFQVTRQQRWSNGLSNFPILPLPPLSLRHSLSLRLSMSGKRPGKAHGLSSPVTKPLNLAQEQSLAICFQVLVPSPPFSLSLSFYLALPFLVSPHQLRR